MESYGTRKLTRFSNNGTVTCQVVIPAPINRALLAKGYNAVEIFLTEDGILFKPITIDSTTSHRKETATLPWDA